ncbi:MAG TPA: type II toxin-antitoxin system death-on-curing family toxin [Pyrinomonadaceae bacterium]
MAFLFLRKQEVLGIHAQAIEAFGGSPGLRDEGALESALTAVENRAYYEAVDLPTCAATYAYHLTQAHAFVDGNKRIAAAAAEIFLEINGARLAATNDQLVALFLDVASGRLSRDKVVELFRQWVVIQS